MIYIDSKSLSPYFNFALEYYLMTEKELSNDIIFMFWRTSPTLMIGKFQNTIEEINQKYVEENNINVVRRMSGGGTIYTDMNGWQFTFITKNYNGGGIDFKKFTLPIINALKSQGVDAYLNSRNDLLINEKKFSGNAQYIKGNNRLHHGSILFNTNIEEMIKCLTISEDKIISKGIKSVRERVTNISEYINKEIDTLKFKEIMLQNLISDDDEVYELNESDIKRIKEISKEIFETWEWNYGSSPKFNITKSKRFKGGKIEFKVNVEKGTIKEVDISGDFFSDGDIDEVCKLLYGCRYNKEYVSNVLNKIDIEKYFYSIKLEEIIECLF